MRKSSLSIRKLAVIAAVTAAAALAASLAVSSSHREAPNIMLDPSADNTDVYAWTAPDAKNAITVASNWIPGQVPANGPNFFRFDDRAKYYIQFDNTGDGVADVKYLFRFNTRFRNPNSFLYAGPGTMDFNDPGLNLIQRYDVTRLKYKRGELKARKVVAEGLPVAPPNIGPKTFPEYDNFVDAATRRLPGGGKIFVGQRDDPFYVDLGATFDAINIREGTGNEGEGKDDFSGYSTSSIVLQLPEAKVTKDREKVSGADAKNAVVGVWSTTDRRRLQVTNAAGLGSQSKKGRHRKNRYVQVSRLGNPLINEVVIPIGKKDQFNRTTPDEDAARYGKFALNPELAAVLNALFGVGAPETDRTDVVQALLQGLPGLNQHSGRHAGDAVDTLKLNLGVPPSDDPDRFGVIGGDNAGFPNGRRLEDDVVDIELQVVAGILVGNPVALGDGVDKNDKPFLSQFPYLAAPDSGFDSNPSDRFEPPHGEVPPGG
ncbi:MAG TPA: DUF4331 domain-containing protein [Solirubrobacterales bacterium]|nr:DUF4331 domain-containing protein [Solirubrobacterales bacterium]